MTTASARLARLAGVAWLFGFAQSTATRLHPLELLAAVVLALTGFAFVGGGVWLAAEGFGKAEPSGGVRQGMVTIGLVVIAVGALKLWAAWRIWIHREDGRSLGLAIATVGTFVGAIAAFLVVRGSPGPDFIALLLPVPYVIVLVGLAIGRRHFGAPDLR